jgi:hypothetical protein
VEEVFGSIEAVKTVSDLFSPLSGVVTEFNEALEDTPESVNNDPYGSRLGHQNENHGYGRIRGVDDGRSIRCPHRLMRKES